MSKKTSDWLEPLTIQPDRRIIKEALATYARVVRKELPPQQRPEFQLSPEDRSRRIS